MSDIRYDLDEVIICTKDRPDALNNAIKSIESQTRLPSRILIVDSSNDLRSFELVKFFQENSRLNLLYIQSKPGLTFQRNLGIQNLLEVTQVIHFLDDDVELIPDYLEEILSCFQRNSQAIGVGGNILNTQMHTPRLHNRIVGMTSVQQGRVLRSGTNVGNYDGSSDRNVDWLAGCSMSFRRDVFSSTKFDERRTGNGIGEDVDFCLRAKETGDIVWTPHAKLFHLQSPINRLDRIRTRNAAFKHKLLLASDGLGRVRRFNVFWSEFFQTFFSIIKCLLRGKFGVIKREYRFWKSVSEI